ncbi:phosphoribosyl-ATP diphosphatase [Hyphomicrobium methylovorum]|uniref:phosphoribosyl-ATP diphosphatase n=1 Tax=Hyphomicrobium methylovorum TaxID=84 RepID=UPI0015E71D28|nr:phosphoribosyl-ATP diphosphatase [Hyphomicrobium methylovorum]MBA2126144.1 phosphoribosyl-ATP diphosphatase [Hyphomicrobium methylovorum]
MSDTDTLQRLAALIRSRRSESADSSYTAQLLTAGTVKCARKLGEEAIETVIAAIDGSPEELTAEAADTLYHLLVVLESRGVDFDDVLRVLAGRMGMSGLAEKASRPRSPS